MVIETQDFTPRIAQAVGRDIDGTPVIGPKIFSLPSGKVMLLDGHYRTFVTERPLNDQEKAEMFTIYGIRVD